MLGLHFTLSYLSKKMNNKGIVMDKDSLEINCKVHGQSDSSVVCGHLINNTGFALGFIENSSIPSDFQGWCYACEFVFSQEQDMTDDFKAFNQMTMVCEQC